MSTVSLKSGDTIWGIVQQKLGPGATNKQILDKTNEILKLNNITAEGAKRMHVGDTVKLSQDLAPKAPAPAPAPKPAPAPTPAAPAPTPAAPAPAPAQGGANANVVPGSLNGGNSNPNQITVAQIDNFETDNTGFNHGVEIANTINRGGGDPALAGQINLVQFGVGQGDVAVPRDTASALQEILNRIINGQDIDAVNMSLQDFNSDGNTAKVQELIRKLTERGVPVLVAAGNNGPQAVNQLAGPGALVIESTTQGIRNPNSGIGNLSANAETTSFATANVSPVIARMINSGMTLQQIFALIQQGG